MKSTAKIYAVLLLLILLIPNIAWGACPAPVGTVYTATDATKAEVQDCIDDAEAASGGTVIIPAGTPDAYSGLSKTITHDLIIQGAGTSSTVLTSDSTSVPILSITLDGTAKVTVKDIKFVLVDGNNTNGVLNIRGTSPNRILTGCYFDMTPMSGHSGRAVLWGNPNDATQGGGVIYNNTFYNNGTNGQAVGVSGNSAGDYYYWTGGTTWGSGMASFTFIEGNTFQFLNGAGDGAFDAYSGSKLVFRYNEVIGTQIGWHGNDSSHGLHSAEIYRNNFTSAPSSVNFLSNARGGTAYIWGNRADSTYATGMTLALYRSCSAMGRDGKLCQGSGDYDSNSDATGYVCYQQPGTTGTDGVTSAPMLAWDNSRNGDNVTFTLNANYLNPTCDQTYDMSDHVKENRDYCQHASTMPASCNGVTTSYTPHTCPHPLTGYAGACTSTAGVNGYNQGNPHTWGTGATGATADFTGGSTISWQ